ncbi:MAG: hypothetical protein ACXVB9_12845 [Bdellovibrionota bacterium]
MELVLGQSMARKVLLLQSCQTEILVLTSASLAKSWSPALTGALQACAQRGVKVRILLESGRPVTLPALSALGAEVRTANRSRWSWMLRAFPVRSELWVFDGEEALSVNQRTGSTSPPMECLMGADAAHGLTTYFERRWDNGSLALTFSVRHKHYSFHSGRRADLQFFSCVLHAQREITLYLPGGRVSRTVEGALQRALSHGLTVNVFTNAERDDTPALRRLRRLAAAGATVKICGNRLSSEGAVVDGQSVYLGPLPASWHRWSRGSCPVFVVNDRQLSQDLLGALDLQVSVEVSGSPSRTYAFR